MIFFQWLSNGQSKTFICEEKGSSWESLVEENVDTERTDTTVLVYSDAYYFFYHRWQSWQKVWQYSLKSGKNNNKNNYVNKEHTGKVTNQKQYVKAS